MQATDGTALDTDRPAPDGQGQALIAVASLLGCGALLALSTNLAKVANVFGIAPLPVLTWSLAGATLLLSAVALFRGQRPVINRRSTEYYVLAGLLSVAGANLIFFNAVPHVGVSFVVLTISLPPVLTYVAALLLRMESFCWWRAAGVVLALCGTSVIVAGQFLLLFILQKAGGPVFLSLTGAVSAVIGVPIAMILLKESFLPALLPSAMLIGAGIISMVIGMRARIPKTS